MSMSKRLQLLLADDEIAELKGRAREERMTVSAWVRRAIYHEMNERPASSVRAKLELIDRLSDLGFPSGDYRDIAADIESDYGDGLNDATGPSP